MLRRARHIIIFLLLGAIVNVAVAWGCAIAHGELSQQWSPHHNPRGEDPLVLMVTDNVGHEIVSGCGRSGTMLSRHGDKIKMYHSNVWWSSAATDPLLTNYAIASGWPCLSLSAARTTSWNESAGETDDGTEYDRSLHNGLLLNAEELAWDGEHVQSILPLRPIFPGFLINTIFYAAFLWLLFAIPFTLRRRLRLRRGHCPHCDYPFGDSPTCTECGRDLSRWISRNAKRVHAST